jgi:hypothetical protein
MLVLQSCTDSLSVLPSLSSETFPTPSDGTYDGNITLEEDIDVTEESFISVNKEEDVGIKQEEIPQDITFPDIKSEPDEVSYVCICLLLDTIHMCPDVSFFYVLMSGELKELHFCE